MAETISSSIKNREKLNTYINTSKESRNLNSYVENFLKKDFIFSYTRNSKLNKFSDKIITSLNNDADPNQLELTDFQQLSYEKKKNYFKLLDHLNKEIEKLDTISQEVKKHIIQEIYKTLDLNDYEGKKYLSLKAIREKNIEKLKKYQFKDKEGNNFLHIIVSLPKGQKVKYLDLINKAKIPINEEISSRNTVELTPIKTLMLNKIENNLHYPKKNFFNHKTNTIKCAIELLKLGANVSDLDISKEQQSHTTCKRYTTLLNVLRKSIKEETTLSLTLKNKVLVQIKKILNGNYPLHAAIINKNKSDFQKLLKAGYDVSNQNELEDTALHDAVKLEGKEKYEFAKNILEKQSEVVNIQNQDGNTPLYVLLQYMKEKGNNKLLNDFLNTNRYNDFLNTNRYKVLGLLLNNGADITIKNKEGNNALHYIALLPGKQKIVCYNLIKKCDKIPQKQLIEAICDKNKDRHTPIQVALSEQSSKPENKLTSAYRKIIRHYHTADFCTELLKHNFKNKEEHLILSKERYSRKYYKTIKRIEPLSGIALPAEIKENLISRYSEDKKKKCNTAIPVKWIIAGLISATVFSALAGNMANAAIFSSIIAICAICYPIYLKLENVLNKSNGVSQEQNQEGPNTNISSVSKINRLTEFFNRA